MGEGMKQGAIFLSASVPVEGRGNFYKNADPMLIQAAVRALVSVILGKRLLVWGGHPAITPMIRAMADNLAVEYSQWVHLYQSAIFEGQFPEANAAFKNVTIVEALQNDRDASLKLMRERMLSEREFSAAVFIGGMEGIFAERDLFQKLQPEASIIPVALPGGAASQVYDELAKIKDLPYSKNSMDFIGLFYKTLHIDPQEPRAVVSH